MHIAIRLDHRMEFAQQYLDSINVPGHWFITGLWAPVGLRYHATHHLFMSMPYHNLAEAQQRLVNGLRDNTLYLTTVRTGMWDALQRIWAEATASTSPKGANRKEPLNRVESLPGGDKAAVQDGLAER